MSFWFTLTVFRIGLFGNAHRWDEKAADIIIFYRKSATFVMSKNTDIDCI